MNRPLRILAGTSLLGALVLGTAAPSAAQSPEPVVVAADTFDDARFPCSFPCIIPPTSGNANEPVSAGSAPPFANVPVGVTYVSNSDRDGSTGPNPRGASGLSASRPSTWGGNQTRTALGASNGSIDTLLDLDARAVEIDANAVMFSFVDGEQVAPTVLVAAYGADGALLDTESFVAGERSGPVRLEAAEGEEITRVNASSADGVVTVHGISVLAAGGGVDPQPEPQPEATNPLCSILPFFC